MIKKMNKRGLKLFGLGFEAGDSSAGFYFVLLLVYFLIFIVVVNAVDNIDPDEPDVDISDNSDYNAILGHFRMGSVGYCESPRYKYLPSGEVTEITLPRLNHMRCEWTEGALNETLCNNIKGCKWSEVSQGIEIFGFCLTGLWTDCDDFYTCNGRINGTYYNISQDSIWNVQKYEYNDYIGKLNSTYDFVVGYLGYNSTGGGGNIFQNIFLGVNKSDSSICTHPYVIVSEPRCELFSCTWNKIQQDNDFYGAGKSFWKTAGQIFTLTYDFDKNNTMNDNLETVLYIIFFGIPFLLLLVTGFYAVFGK